MNKPSFSRTSKKTKNILSFTCNHTAVKVNRLIAFQIASLYSSPKEAISIHSDNKCIWSGVKKTQ